MPRVSRPVHYQFGRQNRYADTTPTRGESSVGTEAKIIDSLIRILTALLPLALVPVLVHLIAYGTIDLGGGEKDLVLVLPWFVWSLVFAVSALYLWRRGWSLSRSLLRASLLGLLVVFLAAVTLALIGQLGVGGRF